MVASLGWNWLVRLQGQTLFQSQFCPAQAVKGLLNCAGQRCKKWGKLFKKQGWRTGSVVAIWHKPYREPLVLGSNLPPDYSMLRYYKYRFAIESMFRDCKSLGFQWEGSQVRVLEHCQKVVLGLCWGVLIAVVLGEQVAQEEMGLSSGRAGYSRPHSAKFSLVYKGLERVQSYVVGKVQKPIEWELSYYEAERWSKQCHQQFALRYLATSQPSPQLKAA
jgi:hypothetical protein